MKKVVTSICIIVLFICTKVSMIHAAPLITLTHWYSEANKIGAFDETDIDYVVESVTCGMTTTAFENTIGNAVTGWDSEFSFDMNEVSSSEHISFDCLTRSEATLMGINPYAVGMTNMTYYVSPFGTYYNPSNTIVYFHYMYHSDVYLIWDTVGYQSAKTSDYTTSQWNEISAHETGHAFGYFGHADSIYQLMYPYTQDAFEEPQTNDISHMDLIYN